MNSSKNHGVRVLGSARTSKGRYSCGVCGRIRKMTKAHVPPQCAGNSLIFPSYRIVSVGQDVKPGRTQLGGISFLGHCQPCNSAIGQLYDAAYGDFARSLRQVWIKDHKLTYPSLIKLPDSQFIPGKVVRSILLAMCATSPYMFGRWPDFVEQMMAGEPTSFPPELRLYLALARGRSARVNGLTSGMDLRVGSPRDEDGTPLVTNSASSVYFPPLAWEALLGDSGEPVRNGWADVSNWSELQTDEVFRISELLPSLPSVTHPQHSRETRDHWTEAVTNDFSNYAECMDIERIRPDPALQPSFLGKVSIGTAEIDEARHALGPKSRPSPSAAALPSRTQASIQRLPQTERNSTAQEEA